MKSSKLYLTIAALMVSVGSLAQAHIMTDIGYQELFDKSDLIVIAEPVTKTTDTKETTYFSGIVSQDMSGKQSKVAAIGVETVFAAHMVIKGNKAITKLTLHHYRDAPHPSYESVGGASVVSFDPSVSGGTGFLLFLVKEKDGRYAPYGGQTDPSGRSIFALESPPIPNLECHCKRRRSYGN